MPFGKNFIMPPEKPELDDNAKVIKPKPDPIRSHYDQWIQNTTPDTQSTSKMLQLVKPSIEKGISAHAGKQPGPLVSSRARQIALGALRSWDPQGRANLNTHIVNNLQGLKRYAVQATQGISAPERVRLDKKQIDDLEEDFNLEYGREPTMQELADKASLSPKRIAYIRGYAPPAAEGQFVDDTGQPFQPAVNSTQSGESWLQLVYDDLGNSTDKLIMEHTLGLHGKRKMSNIELAMRLNLTQGAVSQRKARLQATLDQEHDISPFRG